MITELFLFVFITIISFVKVYFVGKFNFEKGIKGTDINKLNQPKLPESTGIALLTPLIIGIVYLNYIIPKKTPEFVSWFLLVLSFGLIGLLDDRRHKFSGKALSWTVRALPIGLIAFIFAFFFLPLTLQPIWLWTILIGLFIAGLASFENTFAGLNGWEIGSGFIISLFTLYILWSTEIRMLAIVVSASILGLLLWNKFPAKVFPGDSGTLMIGASIAGLFVLTKDIQTIMLGTTLFLPHMVDFFLLKFFSNKHDVTQQKLRPYKVLSNETLTIPNYPDKKIRYDFAKLILKFTGPLKEWQIVLIIWLIVILNGLIMLGLFGRI